MTLSGSIAVAGVYEHPTRWAPDKTEFQIMAESAKGALDDAGLTIGDVDALFAASMTMSGMGIVDLADPFCELGKGAAVFDFLEGFAFLHVAADLADEQDHRDRILLGDV